MHRRTKIKIAIFVLLVGMACTFTAVVTDHWAVLSPRVERVNETCEAAHFGLWRLCKKQIYMSSENNLEQGCGPISLPGEENCTYFGHFTPGKDSEIFEYKTQKAPLSVGSDFHSCRTSDHSAVSGVTAGGAPLSVNDQTCQLTSNFPSPLSICGVTSMHQHGST
ncbi:unnamed protein product [Pleuronectes platessa]|uniref:Voltage-dependent calcium channel gamma-1 subunit n=1 Tax=Pleuronectes platessa TaxID=8262 RepID=A0A9N7UAZ4_PLEPL|nr:unnamed protein product [Pleuronectes platessa]